jgi:hypothetical protein
MEDSKEVLPGTEDNIKNISCLNDKKKAANILGILSIIFGAASFIPFMGFLSIIGAIAGTIGIFLKEYTKNIIGTSLSIIGLITSPMLLGAIYCLFTDCEAKVTEKFDNITFKSNVQEHVALPKPNLNSNNNDLSNMYELINTEHLNKTINEYYILIGEELATQVNVGEYIKTTSKQICEKSTSDICKVYTYDKITFSDITKLTDTIKDSANAIYKGGTNGDFEYSSFMRSLAPNDSALPINSQWSVLAPNVYYVGGQMIQEPSAELYIHLKEEIKNVEDKGKILASISNKLCEDNKEKSECNTYFWFDKAKVPTINPVAKSSKGFIDAHYSFVGEIEKMGYYTF